MKVSHSHSLFILLSITSLLISPSFQKCGFSIEQQRATKISKIDLSQGEPGRFLSSASWTPINIYVDYSQLDSTASLISAAYMSGIKAVMSQVVGAYSALLSVKSLGTPLSIHSCDDLKVSAAVMAGVQADLIIIPNMDPTVPADVEAWASFCAQDTTTGRPLAGYIGFGGGLDFTKKNAVYYISLLVLHEMNHILSFNPALFPSFIDASGQPLLSSQYNLTETVNGLPRLLMATPKVIEVAKLHYNCATLKGVELENQGGSGTAGSHWEARVMAGDYMMGQSYEENVISPMSLALMEDSGWYQVNYYTAGLFRFGKNEGCGFLNTPCVTNGKSNFPNEYSDQIGSAMCYAGKTSKGVSSLITENSGMIPKYKYFTDITEGGNMYADFCPIAGAYADSAYYHGSSCLVGNPANFPAAMGETIGADSSCFMTTLTPSNDNTGTYIKGQSNSICYHVTCNSDLTYTVSIGAATVKCPSAGGLVSVTGFDGTFNCVDYNLICTRSASCSDVFDCIKKKVTGLTPNYNYLGTTSTTGNTGTTIISTSSGYISFTFLLYAFSLILV